MTSDRVNTRADAPGKIELPAPTAWPIVAAFGVALLFAGLVTTMVLRRTSAREARIRSGFNRSDTHHYDPPRSGASGFDYPRTTPGAPAP
jgi:hypothetical protein